MFPSFIVQLSQAMEEKSIIKYLIKHFTSINKFKLELEGHRLKNNHELLLFVLNRKSSSMLYDGNKWPELIESLVFQIISPKHLPSQLSFILRKVPMNMNANEISVSIQNEYREVVNAFKISNKFNQPTTFVRLDIKYLKVIEELLRKKYILLDDLRLAVTEYIAPMKVLICSKCFQIDHFMGTCKSTLDSCRSCGAGVMDLKSHKDSCNKKLCCIRCKGEHEANDVRCPEIKSYRTVLTKSLLSTVNIENHQQKNLSFQLP